MTSTVVDVQVLGKNLKLNCPADQVAALNQAADDLNQRLDELRHKTQLLSSDQILITASLNISYELTQERAKTAQLQQQLHVVEQYLQQLQQQIQQRFQR